MSIRVEKLELQHARVAFDREMAELAVKRQSLEQERVALSSYVDGKSRVE